MYKTKQIERMNFQRELLNCALYTSPDRGLKFVMYMERSIKSIVYNVILAKHSIILEM